MIFSYLYAQWEADKYVDEKYGKLLQLNFNPESEVDIVDDGFLATGMEEEQEDDDAPVGEPTELKLQSVAKAGTFEGWNI